MNGCKPGLAKKCSLEDIITINKFSLFILMKALRLNIKSVSQAAYHWGAS